MIRVIVRDILGDTGSGTLVGDFEPTQIGALVKLFRDVPGYYNAQGPGRYQQVAEGVQNGPIQWVEIDGRVILEILVEALAEDEEPAQREFVIDETSFVGFRYV